MVKSLLVLGAGVAAVGLARFAKTAITEERQRRSAKHVTHETHRWEGEGGHVMSPQTSGESAAMARF